MRLRLDLAGLPPWYHHNRQDIPAPSIRIAPHLGRRLRTGDNSLSHRIRIHLSELEVADTHLQAAICGVEAPRLLLASQLVLGTAGRLRPRKDAISGP